MILELDKLEMLLIMEKGLSPTNTLQVLYPPNPTIFPIKII